MTKNTQLRIRVDDAARYFGSKAELARRLGIAPQSLTTWGEYMPELRAYRLRDLFPDEVKFMAVQSGGGLKALNGNKARA